MFYLNIVPLEVMFKFVYCQINFYYTIYSMILKFALFIFSGGRFDLGILYFSSQIWCSDNTDAIARMKIQYGTSLAYPARCIGAHISDVPNHITGNTTRSKTRALIAMCGTFG